MIVAGRLPRLTAKSLAPDERSGTGRDGGRGTGAFCVNAICSCFFTRKRDLMLGCAGRGAPERVHALP